MKEDSVRIKILFLGESNVGKTSIIKKFLSDDFDYNKYTISGANNTQKSIFYKKFQKLITFDIWDTSGQKKFRPFHRILYKDTNVFILIYDITDISSFEEIKNYWINEIKSKASENSCK